MQLLILRHGHADAGSLDQSRQLSVYGREQVRKQMLRHHRDISATQVVLSSPYVRTAQTAEIITQATAAPSIQWSDDLVPNGSLRRVEALLQQYQASNVLLVKLSMLFLTIKRLKL